VPAKVAHCTKRWPALQKPPILAEGTKVGPSRLQGGNDKRMASIEEPITLDAKAGENITFVVLRQINAERVHHG